MADPRVTQSDVEEIFNNPKSFALSPYITAAHLVVENRLVGKLDEGTLKEIERWLAAHFAAAGDERLRAWRIQEFGENRAEVTGKFGMGLDLTQYGQMVKVLDTTGTLVRSSKPGARFAVI